MLVVRLARRAAWEVKNGQPALARKLLHGAAAHEGVEAEQRVDLLEQALDVCLEYLPADGDEVHETATALLQATRGADARAHKALGICLSLRARAASAASRADASRELFDASKAAFERSLELLPEDADARASLGGLHRRAAEWAAGAAERRAHEDLALAAYERAATDGSCPYAVLNAIEYGAVVRYRRALAAAGDTGSPPDAVLFAGGSAEIASRRSALSRALFIRERQLRRGEDRPWAAFDLARGRHYLKPNVIRLLRDLDVAVAEAREVARGPSDAWLLQSAARTFRDLCAVGVPVDGLTDALLLLQRATYDERWTSGDFGAAPGSDAYLTAELMEVRTHLETLAGAASEAKATKELLSAYVTKTTGRWAIDDEERFQAEVDVFLKAIEPTHKKTLRAVWRWGGKSAVGIAIDALVPGATAAQIVGSVAEGLVEHALNDS